MEDHHVRSRRTDVHTKQPAGSCRKRLWTAVMSIRVFLFLWWYTLWAGNSLTIWSWHSLKVRRVVNVYATWRSDMKFGTMYKKLSHNPLSSFAPMVHLATLQSTVHKCTQHFFRHCTVWCLFSTPAKNHSQNIRQNMMWRMTGVITAQAHTVQTFISHNPNTYCKMDNNFTTYLHTYLPTHPPTHPSIHIPTNPCSKVLLLEIPVPKQKLLTLHETQTYVTTSQNFTDSFITSFLFDPYALSAPCSRTQRDSLSYMPQIQLQWGSYHNMMIIKECLL
jgi:hypothetical protein